MSQWITDRTQADVDRVSELHEKAILGTWTEQEQEEWLNGMKGALNAKDFNRIARGMRDLLLIVEPSNMSDINDNVSEFSVFSTSDISDWSSHVAMIREKCSGMASTPEFPTEVLNGKINFSQLNQIEQILNDIETLVKSYMTFSGEFDCGGGQYGF